MPIQSLPLEIIGDILRQTSDSNDQARCCLVSKSFLPFARQELYRRATIDYSSASGRSLLRLLASEPHLATLVLEFTFSWWSPRDAPTPASTSDDFQEELALALSPCCSLVNLMLFVAGRQDAPSVPMAFNLRHALEDIGQRLKALVIHGAHYWSTGVDDVLAAQLALKELWIDLRGVAPPRRPPRFQLQTFRCDAGRWGALSWDTVGDLIATSHPTLTELKLEARDAPSVAELNLAPFDALRRVVVICDLQEDNNAQRILALLATAPNIEHVRLYDTYDHFSYVSAPSLERIDFLRHHLPLSLRELHLPELPFSTAYLLAVISDHRYLRRLTTLWLDPRRPAEGDEGKPTARSAEEEEDITRAGIRRGLGVEWVRREA